MDHSHDRVRTRGFVVLVRLSRPKRTVLGLLEQHHLLQTQPPVSPNPLSAPTCASIPTQSHRRQLTGVTTFRLLHEQPLPSQSHRRQLIGVTTCRLPHEQGLPPEATALPISTHQRPVGLRFRLPHHRRLRHHGSSREHHDHPSADHHSRDPSPKPGDARVHAANKSATDFEGQLRASGNLDGFFDAQPD